MRKLNLNYDAKRKVASIAFYVDNELCELTIDQNGECEYLMLDEFLGTVVQIYRIEMFSVDTLLSIGR